MRREPASRRPERRILFVIPSLEGGGAERVVTHLLRGLASRTFDLHLALFAASGAFMADVPDSVTIHDLGSRRVRNGLPSLLRLVWRLRPDVVVPATFTVPLMMGLRPFFPRSVALLARESLLPSNGLRAWRPWLPWPLPRLLYRQATGVICPAAAMAEELVRSFGVPAERIHHIPNPVDAGAIARRADGSPSPYAGPGPHLLSIGRLEPQKGFDRLLSVLARLGPAGHLWILGTGTSGGPLREEANRLGLASRVHFQGFVANPFVWLRHADLFVQGSRFEGSPNALLEALACGTRVVAFDSPGGTREILEGLPGTALVADGDTDAFATAVRGMLSASRPAPPALPARHAYEVVMRQYERLLSGDRDAACSGL